MYFSFKFFKIKHSPLLILLAYYCLNTSAEKIEKPCPQRQTLTIYKILFIAIKYNIFEPIITNGNDMTYSA